ncbi:unnamed protein product, partial [Symbiodinium microadriaticum]
MAAGEHVSLLGKLNERIKLSEEYKTKTENMIHRILEQHAMWRAQHTAILEVYAALGGWTKDAAQQVVAAALPSLQRSCPSDSSAPRPTRSEQIVVLDGPNQVWDRDFGNSEFHDQVPNPIEREMSQQVIAEESVDVLEDDDVMLVAEEPYPGNTQSSQQPDSRSSLGRQFARSQLARMSARSSEFDSPSFCSGMSADELGKQILTDLDRIPDKEWETRSRENVRPAGEAKSLQKTLGLFVGARWHGIPMPTTDTFNFRKLTGNILLYARQLGVGEATSIQVTKNLCTRPHRDVNNRGPSRIFGLGDWTEGGETFVQDDRGTEKHELQEHIPGIGPKGKVLRGFKKDIHTLQQFDGTKIHCTVPFKGTRYAIILYAIHRSYHEAPALARALLVRLGFNLPLHEFEANMQAEDEELAGAVVEGRPEADEPGRHPPPTGRPRPPKRLHEDTEEAAAEPQEPSAAKPGQPAMALPILQPVFRSPDEPEVQELWSDSDMEAARKKLERDLACQQEAGRQAEAQREAAAEDDAQTKDELEQNLFQTKRELTSLKWQYDQLMADRDQSLQKAANVEAALKSADLRQAVESACCWTEQDAAKAAEARATGFEEQAANLRHTVYRLESELGHQRAIAMVPREVRAGAPSPGLWGLSGKLAQVLALLDASSLEEGLRRLRAECEDLKAGLPSRPGQGTVNPVDLEFADIHLRKQYAAAESKVAQLQDAVAFLTQRAAIGSAEAKAGKAHDMLKK